MSLRAVGGYEMKVVWWHALFASCVWFLLSSGCGKNQNTDAGLPQVCEPGTVYSCVRGSCTGHQSCNTDGTSYTRCVCNDADAASSDAGSLDASSADASLPPDASSPTDAAPTMDKATPTGRVEDASVVSDARVDAQAPTEPERCDNDLDDDGDNHVDCADDDCSEVTCVSQAPRGWHGPVAMRRDAAGGDCGEMFSQTALDVGAEPDGPTTCSACTCSGGATGCAAFVDFGTGTNAQCAAPSCTTSINQSCSEIMPPCIAGQSSAFLQTKLPQATGSCTPSEIEMTGPAASWKLRAKACSANSFRRGGCKTGQVCLPSDPGPAFEARYCIWQDGQNDCPGATFTDKRTYFRELNDTRSCSACSCNGPNCRYSWNVFNDGDTSCSTPLLQLDRADQCVQVNPANDRLRVGASIDGDGTCAASGGQAQGSVTGSKAVTVCCEPE